ncbi:MAG: lecithin retinol acyltransferase family protein [Spirochaetes bacterium]|nr:lecithin retinol acyltransferase family protein [Spirochaetota bacterium]
MKKGDVIWTFRFPYFHCGIYENDNSVIHFAPIDNDLKSKATTSIIKTPLDKFANGFPVFVIEFPDGESSPPDEVIRCAYSSIGKTGYNLAVNNCDHFATWCKTGKQRSIQVDFVKEMIVAVCKKADKSNDNKTNFEKYAKIACKIHEIAEIEFGQANSNGTK